MDNHRHNNRHGYGASPGLFHVVIEKLDAVEARIEPAILAQVRPLQRDVQELNQRVERVERDQMRMTAFEEELRRMADQQNAHGVNLAGLLDTMRTAFTGLL